MKEEALEEQGDIEPILNSEERKGNWLFSTTPPPKAPVSHKVYSKSP